MPSADLSELEYLRHIALLARDVVHAADDEGWLTYGHDAQNATPLQRVVNELARQIRNTWANNRQPISVILTDTAGTEGMLMNWARGITRPSYWTPDASGEGA
ncbi:hypothetical protein [Nonomuraea sp. NPDC049158]|uniref:hypothetical protein n=1 Tax=Nonomuraea sp. NPDC049158 TaxID=3155649 RepID=UPI00340D0C06